MKITIFTLIACLCLVAVSANGGAYMQPESADVDKDLDWDSEDYADGIVDIELFGFKSVVKNALRSIKALNCSIKAALIMKDAAEQAKADIQACGGVVSKQLQNVINQLNKIISICNDIINLNDNVCNTDDEDGQTSKPCFVKMFKKMWSLYKNIKKCISMIKKVPTAGANASDCVNTALTKVSNTFNQFPAYITECSKLTS